MEYKARIDTSNIIAGTESVRGVAMRRQARATVTSVPSAGQAQRRQESGDSSLTSLSDVVMEPDAGNSAVPGLVGHVAGTGTEGAHGQDPEHLGSADGRIIARALGAAEGQEDNALSTRTADEPDAQSPVGNQARLAQVAMEHTWKDTLDSQGFVVPKRVAKSRSRSGSEGSARVTGAQVFNTAFYDPDAENEKPPKKESTRWSDFEDDDGFGPIPEDWMVDPPRKSTPVKKESQSPTLRWDSVLESAISGLSPNTKDMWRCRNYATRLVVDDSSESVATPSDQSDAELKEQDTVRHQGVLASSVRVQERSESESAAGQIPTLMKGKWRADEPVPGPSHLRPKTPRVYPKPTVEEVTDDEEDWRATQMRHDKKMAKELHEQLNGESAFIEELPPLSEESVKDDANDDEIVMAHVKGADGRMHDVYLPISSVKAALAPETRRKRAKVPSKLQERERSKRQSEDTKHTAKSEDPRRSSTRFSDIKHSFGAQVPLRAGTHSLGLYANARVPEYQMPMNSVLSAAQHRIQKGRNQSRGDPDDGDDDSSSSNSSLSSESPPSSANSSDSDRTRKRKRQRRKVWKHKQKQRKLELAAIKPDPPAKYDGEARWDRFEEFMILCYKFFNDSYSMLSAWNGQTAFPWRDLGESYSPGWTTAHVANPQKAGNNNTMKAKDCKAVNSVNKPAKSLRAVTVAPEEARVRREIRRATQLGFMAVRIEDPHDDPEFITARDKVVCEWMKTKLMSGIPYPNDPYEGAYDKDRFAVVSWPHSPRIFMITDKAVGVGYNVRADQIFDEKFDLVDWLAAFKCEQRACPDTTPEEEVDWDEIFWQADAAKNDILIAEMKAAEEEEDYSRVLQYSMSDFVPSADDKVRLRLRNKGSGWYRRYRYFNEQRQCFVRGRLTEDGAARLDENRWHAGDWNYFRMMQRAYLAKGLPFPSSLLSPPDDTIKVPNCVLARRDACTGACRIVLK
ncbi:hypothetical protein AURDEDRAFT_131516 [Auricularia subglabra TFB-10046 SS5]|uniref:Uncharacterized protein n=1 Tax=Auricularia subglabra (strain TFB-10046 / SS5) TaxID=717982 RepID=J0D4T5_AURST|nr:hypothetical protein AURDEDRAFT_131516 [Auricularia subglabra TFB-10046 SS5]